MHAIADSGRGLSPEPLAHIFEPFFTTKKVGEGTGLGLATVYGVVKQSNGYIWVDSAPDKGSNFQIYLPRHLDTQEVSAEKVRLESRERSHGSEIILLVEDTDPLRKLARVFLESNEFRALSAPSRAAVL